MDIKPIAKNNGYFGKEPLSQVHTPFLKFSKKVIVEVIKGNQIIFPNMAYLSRISGVDRVFESRRLD